MKAGIRVIRGPDWKWGDQDGGMGHIGTVIKPGFPVKHNTVVNGSVFVRWDSGKVGNYSITEQHDLHVYCSTCAGVEHQAFCSTCKEKRNILGTRWRCSSCENFDLCDDCYHGDQHKLDHRFYRRDLPSSEGVLVPARMDSKKLEAKGVFLGAIVIRNVEDWVLGQSDDGAHGTTGTVIINDDGGAISLPTGGAAIRKQRMKAHGSVRVRWSTGNIVEHRRGFEGKVDVFCRHANDTASGGIFYPDHLAVLDSAMVLRNTEVGKSSSSDYESSDGYDSSDESQITSQFSHTGSLDELFALSGRTPLLHHTERFDRGDRVRVLVDPDQFKKMQSEEYGGWDDAMALYIGLTATVLGVLPSGGVAVRYANMPRKRWIVNPDALSKQDYFAGESVQILADEAAVRRLQIGHGGWVYRMKDILGKVGKIVQLNHGNTILVKMDKMEWLLNRECCKLMDDSSSATNMKDLQNDSDDEGTSLSELLIRTGGDLSGVLSSGTMERLLTPEALVEFAARNDIGSVKTILARYPKEIDTKNCNKTALHLAAAHGHVEMVRCLVEHGANILEPDDDGNTPVHYAAHDDKPDALEVMLLKDDDNANAVNFRLISVLRIAVHRQAISCIEVLLRHNVNVNLQDEHGNTSLHDAIIVGCLGAVDLIAAHPKLDYFITNGNGFTVLQLAVMKNDLYSVKSILRHAPQQLVDVQKEDGFTALHIACLNGLYNMAEVLITQGKANMELITNEHRTPLLCALSRAKVSVVELLASHGANVNAYDYQYRTALHWILVMISLGGANSRTVDDLFNAVQTSLIYSELHEGLRDRPWVAVACCLVRYGADIYQADGVGMTPIGLVADSGIRDALLAASRNRFSCIPKT